MTEASKLSEPPRYTLGQLIFDLEGSERAYQENLRTAHQIEKNDGHNLSSTWWKIQAAALLFQPTPTLHPGIDRIEAYCDEWGSGLNSQNVRKLRGRVCSTLGIGVTVANDMTLIEVASVLSPPADFVRTKGESTSSLITKGEDLPYYKAEEQPWYPSRPTVTNVLSSELNVLASEIDVVLMTTTECELEAVLHRLQPYPKHEAVLLGFVEHDSYYLGQFGSCKTVVTRCRMGSLDSGSAILSSQHAIRFWCPRAIVMVGIALGGSPENQKIGDVLIASQIISYEPQRVGLTQTIQRGPTTTANLTLLNRFDSLTSWDFARPDGSLCKRHIGPVLSGEKLIDNPVFKEALFNTFPLAIGGEMEGVGLAAAAQRESMPWILVKAICDWADGYKHKRHQPLAAAAAVSLVHHVLSQPDVLHGLNKKGPLTEQRQLQPTDLTQLDRQQDVKSKMNSESPTSFPALSNLAQHLVNMANSMKTSPSQNDVEELYRGYDVAVFEAQREASELGLPRIEVVGFFASDSVGNPVRQSFAHAIQGEYDVVAEQLRKVATTISDFVTKHKGHTSQRPNAQVCLVHLLRARLNSVFDALCRLNDADEANDPFRVVSLIVKLQELVIARTTESREAAGVHWLLPLLEHVRWPNSSAWFHSIHTDLSVGYDLVHEHVKYKLRNSLGEMQTDLHKLEAMIL